MISVVLIGTGNVAQNLFQAFSKVNDVEVKQVIGRTKSHLNFARATTTIETDFDKLLPADLYVLAISDDAIASVSMRIKETNGLIVHTSGGSSLEALSIHKRAGVFYPLQTFTKGKIISFENLPICIEANNTKDLEILRKLGETLSNRVVNISTEKRKILHLAAVFVNNFTNYMYSIGEDICAENEVDFNLLQPLIEETAHKLNVLSPKEAQTGPAKRGDQQTLQTHLEIIKKKHQRELYTLLSNAIKSNHGEEL
jgi:predicted short-subunit dehydrogenase-like oxidoreductase (DUF2520 family)